MQQGNPNSPFNAFNPKFNQQYQATISAHMLDKSKIRTQRLKMKNNYQFPGRLDQAVRHRDANMFGYLPSSYQSQEDQRCSCCGRSIDLQPASLCSDLTPVIQKQNQIRQISADVTLFFHFAKIAVIYLLVRLVLVQGFQLLALSSSNYVVQHHKYHSFNGLMALTIWPAQRFRYRELLQIECFINMAYVVVMIIFFLIYRSIQSKYYDMTHSEVYNQSDFTIMVENIPFFSFMQNQQTDSPQKLPPYYQLLHLTQNDVHPSEIVRTNNANIIISQVLRLFFNRQVNKWRDRVQRQGYQNRSKLTSYQSSFYEKMKHLSHNNAVDLDKPVKSVNLCFDMGDLDKVRELREKLMKQHKKNYQSSLYVDQQSKNYPPNQIQLLGQKQIQIMKHYATLASPELTLSHFLGTAFVTFQHEQIKSFFVHEHQSNLKLVYDDQTCLKISEAPTPGDVNWFKMNSESWNKTKTIVQAIFLVLLLVVLFLGIVYLIQFWRIQSNLNVIEFSTNNKKLFQKTQVGVIFFFFSCMITKILQAIIGLFINSYCQHSNISSKSSQLMFRILLKVPFYFMFLVLAGSIFSSYWTNHLKSWDQASTILSLFVTQCIIMRTMPNLLQVDLLIQKIKLKCFYSDQTNPVYQIHLNKLYQKPQFDLSQRYSFFAVWIFIISFYGSLSPIPLATLIIFFIIHYWLDKFNLLNRNSSPISLTKQLSKLLLRIMEIDVIIFAFGNLITMILIQLKQPPAKDKQSIFFNLLHLNFIQMAAVGLIIAILYKIIVEIVASFNSKYSQSKTKTYSQTHHLFRKHYWTQNPATMLGEEHKFDTEKLDSNQTPKKSTVYQYKNSSMPEVITPQKSIDEDLSFEQEIDLSKNYKRKPKSKKVIRDNE